MSVEVENAGHVFAGQRDSAAALVVIEQCGRMIFSGGHSRGGGAVDEITLGSCGLKATVADGARRVLAVNKGRVAKLNRGRIGLRRRQVDVTLKRNFDYFTRFVCSNIYRRVIAGYNRFGLRSVDDFKRAGTGALHIYAIGL